MMTGSRFQLLRERHLYFFFFILDNNSNTTATRFPFLSLFIYNIPFLMKWSLFFVLAVATSTFCSTTATALNNIDPKFIPGRYIVEFSDDDNPLDASCQKFVDMIKDEFGKQSISIVDTFDHSLMKGMTMQLNTLQNDNDDSVSSFSTLHHHDIMDRMMSKIKGQSIVTKMYPVRMLSSPNVSFKTIGYQLGTMNATAMWPHRMTQVDRVQQELKKTGKGIVVGIIDNGKYHLHVYTISISVKITAGDIDDGLRGSSCTIQFN